MVPGNGHNSQIQDIVATDDTLASCGMDDMVMFTKLNTVTQSGCVVLFGHLLSINTDDDTYIYIQLNLWSANVVRNESEALTQGD